MRTFIPCMTSLLMPAVLCAQTMSTIPAGMRLVTPCHYTYGCANAADGSVWFTEYNHQQLRQLNSNGTVSVRRMGLAGMFGITIDKDNNVFVGLELGDVNNPSKIRRIAPNGSESDIVTGITRPRQLTTDTAGNVYFATESPSRISRWNKSTGTVDILAGSLSSSAEGVAVAPDGTVYFSTYGFPESGVAGFVGKISGGTVTTLATGFWRGRGLVLDAANDYLYLCNEADQEDHGNSGMLSKIKISDGTVTKALEGIDYPQFPSRGGNGQIYFALTRDSWIASYDPASSTTESSWSGNSQVKLGISGGTWGTGGGNSLKEDIGGVVSITGNVQATVTGGTVYGWVRVPASLFSLDTNELYTYRCDPEHPAPGIFKLPTVNYRTDTGSCLTAAIALREHVGQRWPMSNPGTCTETAASGFRESPTAYLVYFAWNRNSRVDTILAPSYKEAGGKMTIIKGSEPGWIYAGNPWTNSGQTWLSSGKYNSPPTSGSWAEQDLGAFSGKSKYIYVMWHKNGPYRASAARFHLYDYTEDKQVSVIDETKHADGLSHNDDTFSGWKLLGTKKINITPGTRLRISQDDPVGSTEYLASDAIMLSDFPVVDNTSLGAADDFETLPVLSVTSSGATGLGSHWGMQGLGSQYTTGSTTSWAATIDSNVVADVPDGNYYVDVSWTYFDVDNVNAANVRYGVNGTLLTGTVNQNRSAANQGGAFVQGNSVGTWSGFYRLSGVYAHSHAHPLIVTLNYNASSYGTRRLVADMVRFVPQTDSTGTGAKAPVAMQASSTALSPDVLTDVKNYPDPFRTSTQISYGIDEPGFVSLKIYSLSGVEVATLVDQAQTTGNYHVDFDASGLPSGVYVYKLFIGKRSFTKGMMHIK
ncbi:MAG TPA: T9SS type A sorting domain-containing protein [Puia sp.]|nr:T9SS type A sorting domain-containing protein [Puia sp.]